MRILIRVLIALLHLSICWQQTYGEDRSFDGIGNNPNFPSQGASNQPLVRIVYPAFNAQEGSNLNQFGGDEVKTAPRSISNRISKQAESIESSRGLSDYIWAWGQFLAHDVSLTLTSDGAAKNGSAPIGVGAGDPLGPRPIPFVRSNFVSEVLNPERLSPFSCTEDCREQVNVNTSYIDASTVYGSTFSRAASLRTRRGTGARLVTGEHNLLPFNSIELENENTGRFRDTELFVAGDMRSNENVVLTSMHTVFLREHNRLVDVIRTQAPRTTSEEAFQLARKLVGAQVQAITYNEFLPALMGPAAPKATDFEYSPEVIATATQSFSHGVNRWGHSATSPQLLLVDENGENVGQLALRDAFSNPTIIAEQPDIVDQLLRGAAVQVSQEIDTLVVDELREFLFGEPGNGGLDLVSLNIQRGRDHGLPPYLFLQLFYGVDPIVDEFESLRGDISGDLKDIYQDVFGMDAWVGAMAERPMPDSSLGRLASTIIGDQFTRLRDGDRLFYRSEDAGLYQAGVLREDIKAIIDLDSVSLADVIMQNSGVTDLQTNVFFAAPALDAELRADFNGDEITDAKDIDLLTLQIQSSDPNLAFDLNRDGMVSLLDHMKMIELLGTLKGDTNLDGVVEFRDFLMLSNRFGRRGGWSWGDFDGSASVTFADFLQLSSNFGQSADAALATVPEPNGSWMVLGMLVFAMRKKRVATRRYAH